MEDLKRDSRRLSVGIDTKTLEYLPRLEPLGTIIMLVLLLLLLSCFSHVRLRETP